MDIRKTLSNLVCSTFNIPETVELDDAGLGKTPSWTSLMHIKLILLVENKFNVKIPSNLILEARDFKSILQILEELLALKK